MISSRQDNGDFGMNVALVLILFEDYCTCICYIDQLYWLCSIIGVNPSNTANSLSIKCALLFRGFPNFVLFLQTLTSLITRICLVQM